MDAEPEEVSGPDATDLTLHEAAALYAVSQRTLAHHLRCGQLVGYKTGGATGRQWRVTPDSLDAAGYRLRPAPDIAGAADEQLVAQLRRELSAARRVAVMERRRAEDADRQLGHALLECGRLRAALAAATGERATSTDPQLDAGAARWLVTAVRSSPRQRESS